MGFPQRKRTRLIRYDYSSPGVYFITICTHHRRNIFGRVVGGDVFTKPDIVLSRTGRVAEKELREIEKHYANIQIDKYVIMPNHIHMLVRITARINPCPTSKRYDIPNIVGKYKAAVTRTVGKAFMPSARNRIWQPSFHDHIIRNDRDYQMIWEYIDDNHAKWKEDCFYIEDLYNIY